MTWNQKKYLYKANTFCSEKCRSEYLASQNKSTGSTGSSAGNGSPLNKIIKWAVALLGLFIIISILTRTEQKTKDSDIPDQVEVISQDMADELDSGIEDSQDQDDLMQVEEEIDEDDIPESLWTRNVYSGTLSGDGRTYNITMAISYPGDGSFSCPIIGSYQYEGHDDLISLEGDWIELTELSEQYPILYSDEFLERFDLKMNGEDLISSTVLKGTWSKYDNKKDYDNADYPQKQLNVVLQLQQ